jgi:L-lysine 6-transaminase
MHRSSMFGIKADLAKSRGAYLYDVNRQEFVLDLFTMFSALPLGYNHPVFDDESFKQEILEAASVKVTNCEIATEAGDQFAADFAAHPSMSAFKYFHFSCTGALAIEAAIKTAIDYKHARKPRVVTFKESFHGINSYGGFLTDRFGSVNDRLQGMPAHYWGEPLDNPVIRYRDGQGVADRAVRERVLAQISEQFAADRQNVCAVLVEPIQCTAGDQYFDNAFLQALRVLCTDFDVPLIFDEVQTGFGGTGSMWYFEQCGVTPDIVAFGKKAQTSGIMVQEKFGTIFDRPVRLEVTWDGDILDMIRCRYVLRAYSRYNILENARRLGSKIREALQAMPVIRNVRQAGLLIAFDFEDSGARNEYAAELRQLQTIVNRTQRYTVRWRPNLAFTENDVEVSLDRCARALERLHVKR